MSQVFQGLGASVCLVRGIRYDVGGVECVGKKGRGSGESTSVGTSLHRIEKACAS